MKISASRRTLAAFSWLELLVVIVTVMLLFVVFSMVQPFGGNRAKAQRIGCVSNLKQIGLAARMWSNDHEEHFPWTVSTNKEGTMEFAASAEVFRHFVAMTNELSSAKIFVCPNDLGRLRARDFSTPLANSNVSYFIGLDADETRPQTILSGDRNIIGGVTNGAWLVFGTTTSPSWTRDIHQFAGNIGLGDGSVMQMTTQALARQFQAALASQTNSTVLRLAIPRTPQDEPRSLWSSGLLRPLLGALLGGLVVLALWIVVRRGLLAASADATPPMKTDESSAPRHEA